MTEILKEVESRSDIDSGEIDRHRLSLSRGLYLGAWGIEIIAVITGLAISVMVGVTAFTDATEVRGEATNSDYINTLIAVLPFVLVALSELTKIPIAGAAYYARSKPWKYLLSFSLIFLALITFETALNGFERNYSQLNYALDSMKRDYSAIDDRIEFIEGERVIVGGLSIESIESRFNERASILLKGFNESIEELQTRKTDMLTSVDSETASQLRRQQKQLEQRRTELNVRRNKNLETLNRNFDDSQQTAAEDVDKRHLALQRHIDTTASELANVRRSCDERKKAASIFSIGGVKKECDASIADITSRLEKKREDIFRINKSSQMSQITKEYQNDITLINDDTNKDISELDTKINALQSQISRITSTREKDIETQLLPLQKSILSAEANYTKQATKNEAERDSMLIRLGNNQNKMDTLDTELTELRDQRTRMREVINAKANGNQIYRMAMMYTGKESAADVGRDEAALVAVIWFGSLAAVVAFTGILLALASYMLRKDYFSEIPKETVQTGKIMRSIRSYFIARRRVITRPRIEKVFVDREVPKEVIREVPVEKVSIKEVPVEVIRKEIVHVPMYTNDENLLKKV